MSLWSAPVLFIGLPLIGGIALWWLRERDSALIWSALGLTFLLALLAWAMPIGTPQRWFGRTITFLPQLEFFGRRLMLHDYDRTFLTLLFAICTFWFGGLIPARGDRRIIPLGLIIVALLVTALAVEPFLYAALPVELAVLLSTVLLIREGVPQGLGVTRFLIFQSLALPFILLAGWALSAAEANPTNTNLITLAAIFLGLGFAFWLAVFPFYTWIPLLAETSHPYTVGFLLLLLPTVSMMLGLKYLGQFRWLPSLPGTYDILQLVGVIMALTAGVWAAFQRNLGRLFAYGIIIESGYALLAISLGSHLGETLFAAMLLPRMVTFGLWALSLSILLNHTGSLEYSAVKGSSQRIPIATLGIAVAALSVGGLPLLAYFSIRITLLQALAQTSFPIAVAALAAGVGLILGTFRALAALSEQPATGGPSSDQPSHETRYQMLLLFTGVVFLIAMGALPQVFFAQTATWLPPIFPVALP